MTTRLGEVAEREAARVAAYRAGLEAGSAAYRSGAGITEHGLEVGSPEWRGFEDGWNSESFLAQVTDMELPGMWSTSDFL